MRKTIVLFCMAVLAAVSGFAQAKPRLAVAAFTPNIDNEQTRADVITVRNLAESGLRGTGKYTLVSREEIDKLLANQKIALSSISSEENVEKLRLTNIRYIVTGTVDADRGNYIVMIKILDVSNGEFVHIADDHIAQSNIYGGVKGLVAQFIAGMNTDSKGGITQVYKIGDRGQAGGIVFYDKGNNSDGWRYLEAAPQDLGEAQWGWYNNNNGTWRPDVNGTSTAVGSGKRNTQLIVDALKRTSYTGRGTFVLIGLGIVVPIQAAQLCASYTYGGYSDWFLPSKDELDLMYKNLAVKGSGNFTSYWYWSSSQYDTSMAWFQSFSDGREPYDYQHNLTKDNTSCVRAIRAF